MPSNAKSESLPPFEPHVLTLESLQDSKITTVAVYSGRAEVTRVFTFAVKQGQNQIIINGLPNVMFQDSIRVDGRGAGTIQDVAVSNLEYSSDPVTSPKLKALQRAQKVLEHAEHRAQQKIASLDKFISSLLTGPSTSSGASDGGRHTPSGHLKQLLADYNSNMQEAQDDVLDIQDKLKESEDAIKAEEKALEGKKRKPELHMKVAVGIFAESAGDVEIALIYAVSNAYWTPRYDIRVNTQTASKEKTIALVYKAAINQSTGEDWKDVSLVLETASPSFNNSIPELYPWTVSIDQGIVYRNRRVLHSAPAPVMMMSMASSPMSESDSVMRKSSVMREMDFRAAEVTSSAGAVSATFGVPGKMSVPSDGSEHSVTITELKLEAGMRWVCVPKKDIKVHLSAKIKNTSEFLLLAGSASVYVDGSYISRSDVPSVSPEETFDCPLGLDPSIKVTYHPVTRKNSTSGLLTKSDVYTFTQRISLHNTKTIDVENVRVVDQIHVSEDATVVVKLISPALQFPSASGGGDTASIKSAARTSVFGGSSASSKTQTPARPASPGALRIPAPVNVQNGVVAKWEYNDSPEEEENLDIGAIGKDGKIAFVCALPAQGKANMTLQWEITAPAKTKLAGLQ